MSHVSLHKDFQYTVHAHPSLRQNIIHRYICFVSLSLSFILFSWNDSRKQKQTSSCWGLIDLLIHFHVLDLVKFVETAVRTEHSRAPNRPIYLLGDSFGACLALAVAARNPDIDLALILANPGSSYIRSLSEKETGNWGFVCCSPICSYIFWEISASNTNYVAVVSSYARAAQFRLALCSNFTHRLAAFSVLVLSCLFMFLFGQWIDQTGYVFVD